MPPVSRNSSSSSTTGNPVTTPVPSAVLVPLSGLALLVVLDRSRAVSQLLMTLARLGRLRLRALLFVPISFIVYFAHTFGWGTLGLLCFSAEAVRQHDRGTSWWMAA